MLPCCLLPSRRAVAITILLVVGVADGCQDDGERRRPTPRCLHPLRDREQGALKVVCVRPFVAALSRTEIPAAAVEKPVGYCAQSPPWW